MKLMAPEQQDDRPDATPAEQRKSEALTSIAATLRALLIILIAAIAFWLLADIVLLIFAAILVAVILHSLGGALARRVPIPPLAAMLLVLTGMILATGLFLAWLGPRFTVEIQHLATTIGQFQRNIEQQYGQTQWGHILSRMEQSAVAGQPGWFGPSATSIVMGTLGGLGSLLLIMVTAIYLAAAPQVYVGGCIRLVPLAHRPRAREIAIEAGSVLRWWILDQLVDMVAVGVLASIGLSLLDLPMALALGVLAGLLTFIPYIGAFIAAVPGLIVGMTVSPATVLWVIVIYLGCHGVEGYIISPIVTRRTVHLPPALTVFSMAMLGTIYGAFGVVIATPITAVGLVLFREIYVADILGDHDRTDIVSALRSRIPSLRRFH